MRYPKATGFYAYQAVSSAPRRFPVTHLALLATIFLGCVPFAGVVIYPNVLAHFHNRRHLFRGRKGIFLSVCFVLEMGDAALREDA